MPVSRPERKLVSVTTLTTPAPTAELPDPQPGKKQKKRKRNQRQVALVATPFLVYTSIFLFLPTIIVVVGAFIGPEGGFTLDNFLKLGEANTIAAISTSLLVSIVSAFIGAVVGGLAAYVLTTSSNRNSAIRRLVTALSSVLAQFGGVMLAFAFIALISINGIGTLVMRTYLGVELDPNFLSSLPGLILVYCYFQIPLMIIVFLPALDALRPQWREATESLGGSTFYYWRHVGLPILAPNFLGSMLLLFTNAFSAYATAAALFSQRSILVPLMIQGALRNELDTRMNGFAQVLAFSMVIVVAIVMFLYSRIQKRAARWQ